MSRSRHSPHDEVSLRIDPGSGTLEQAGYGEIDAKGVRSVTGWESEQMRFSILNEPGWAGAPVASAAEAFRSITR